MHAASRSRTARRVFRAAFLLALMLAAPALSSPASCDGADPPALVEQARKSLSEGNLPAALALSRRAVAENPDDPDANFVLGLAAFAAARSAVSPDGGSWTEAKRIRLLDEAAQAFRRMLDDRPELPRPRLELARVLFERGRCNEPSDDLLEQLLGDDCEAAEHHFGRVLAGEPPPAVVANVNRFLAAVRARKRLSGSLSLAVAPDTNINRATEASTVRIFGLPFVLDEGARASSGVGLIVSGSGAYRHPFAFQPFPETETRLRLGFGFHRREYGGRRFDDMTLLFDAGPRLLFGRGDVSFLAEASRRWSAGEIYSEGLGGPAPRGRSRIGQPRLARRAAWNHAADPPDALPPRWPSLRCRPLRHLSPEPDDDVRRPRRLAPNPGGEPFRAPRHPVDRRPRRIRSASSMGDRRVRAGAFAARPLHRVRPGQAWPPFRPSKRPAPGFPDSGLQPGVRRLAVHAHALVRPRASGFEHRPARVPGQPRRGHAPPPALIRKPGLPDSGAAVRGRWRTPITAPGVGSCA